MWFESLFFLSDRTERGDRRRPVEHSTHYIKSYYVRLRHSFPVLLLNSFIRWLKSSQAGIGTEDDDARAIGPLFIDNDDDDDDDNCDDTLDTLETSDVHQLMKFPLPGAIFYPILFYFSFSNIKCVPRVQLYN